MYKISSTNLPYILLAAMLAGCGGGSSGDSSNIASSTETTGTAEPTNLAPPANATAATSPAAIDSAVNGTTFTPDEALAKAMAAPATPTSTPAGDASASRVEGVQPTVVALAANGMLIGEGAPTSRAQAVYSSGFVATAVSGNIYYVDSKLGSDSNNGRQAASQSGGVGPWRSLAKLALATLSPGDTVRLACGSTWNETLRVANSGTASLPITVASWPSNCVNRPTIDGSTALAPAAWVQHQGNIWRVALATAPLQLHGSTGALKVAHHPNFGFDVSQPNSLYARIPADGNRVQSAGRTVSTYMPIGIDLKLPAGATIPAGTTVRIRSNSWTLEERVVASGTATGISFTTPTTYPLSAGWGYYLLGQQWMLDSAGEWFWNSSERQLYAWMPDARAPVAALLATQLATGVDLQTRQNITLDNLAVKLVGLGMDLRRSSGVVVRNSTIEDTAGFGINASGSQAVTVQANTVVRTGRDAVTGQDDTGATAAAMRVLDNTIADSAVLMDGETARSLPVVSRAAIRPGGGALVSGNAVTNTAYIGIWPLAASTVSNNVIRGACSTLDDCAGIYVNGALHNTTISGNLVMHSRGALAGKAPAFLQTQAQGIYLDESASLVTVTGNTVTDSDYGIHLHVSARNTISQNTLFGNRNAQIWLQETRNRDYSGGDVYGNTVSGNHIVPTLGTSKGLFLQTTFTDTAHFGSFDQNRYFDRVYGNVAEDRNATSAAAFTLPQWQAATDANNVARANDLNGWGASQLRFAPTMVTGSTIVPNGNVAVNTNGWTAWNQTLPKSSIVREACPAGWCIRYVTGGSSGLFSSPNFAVTNGNWYRISVDVATGTDKQAVDMLVRRGGGGANGYESLSDRSLKITGGRTWTRYSQIFKATKTINVNDPLTKDMGARVDFQGILPGQLVRIANLEIVPVAPAEASSRVDLLLNTQTVPVQVACPVAATQPASCTNYVTLGTSQAVTWPFYLAPRSSAVVYTRDQQLIDSDADSIPDSQDACSATPTGAAVNSRGCGFGQG